jgi:hypothetical protein
MSDGIVSQGTKLEMETGTGAAVTTVTAVVGYPTIITKASHGLTNGTVVTLSAFAGADAALMNDEVVVVKNVTTNTLAVDIDTTGKTLTAANGTLTPVTYTEIGNINDFDVNGDEHNMIDFTHLTSTRAIEKPGIPRGSAMTFPLNWTSDDTGLLAAETARAAKTLKNFKITYSDNSVHSFSGYITNIKGGTGGVDGKTEGSITIHRTSALTLT